MPDVAVVCESAQGLLGHRVDHAGGDQLLHVEDVREARILGPGAGPQRPLRSRAGVSQHPPTLAAKPRPVAPVSQMGVGDRHPAAQRRVGPERGVGLGIDARDKERGHRGDPSDRLAGGDPSLEAAQVGLDHLLVAFDGEEQRDVDVDPGGGQLLDGATPAAVAGTLIRTFGRSRRRQRSSACSTVASASSATSGVHSKEMKPSPPPVRS